ncbi:MAG TPA: hypothetical protein VNN21_06375, partial [Dehalococcoidia bacterium]|nr:hypothetical protein [Dehalococcoidia bacterium]
GVPRFEYLPSKGAVQLQFSWDLDRPILQLPNALLEAFRGRSLKVSQIYEEHNVGTPFIKTNYKKVLIQMESEGRVACSPPASKRRPGTLADRIIVTFPR